MTRENKEQSGRGTNRTPESGGKKPVYRVVDTLVRIHGDKPREYATRRRARTVADEMNQEYGAHRYDVVKVTPPACKDCHAMTADACICDPLNYDDKPSPESSRISAAIVGKAITPEASAEATATPAQPRCKWVVAFEVSDNWVYDQFTLSQDDVDTMIQNRLPYAYSSELTATIVQEPTEADITAAMARHEKASR